VEVLWCEILDNIITDSILFSQMANTISTTNAMCLPWEMNPTIMQLVKNALGLNTGVGKFFHLYVMIYAFLFLAEMI